MIIENKTFSPWDKGGHGHGSLEEQDPASHTVTSPRNLTPVP